MFRRPVFFDFATTTRFAKLLLSATTMYRLPTVTNIDERRGEGTPARYEFTRAVCNIAVCCHRSTTVVLNRQHQGGRRRQQNYIDLGAAAGTLAGASSHSYCVGTKSPSAAVAALSKVEQEASLSIKKRFISAAVFRKIRFVVQSSSSRFSLVILNESRLRFDFSSLHCETRVYS